MNARSLRPFSLFVLASALVSRAVFADATPVTPASPAPPASPAAPAAPEAPAPPAAPAPRMVATPPPTVPRDVVVRAPAAGSARELTVGFVRGALRAKVCAQPGCAVADGAALELPAGADVTVATLGVVRIAKDRSLVHVVVPIPATGAAWEAVLAAPLQGDAVQRLFAGETGLIHGEDGLRSGPMVVITEAEADGTRRVVIGERREDISLCGRPTVIAPQLVVPADLSLRPALMQRLPAAERDAAPALVARRALPDEPPASPGMLRAVAATSAVGDPRALTDGDAATAWAEGRSGAGKGEFAMLHAPPTVPLTGLEIVARPTTGARPDAAGPQRLWVATERQVFAVTFPEDPFAEAGARYVVDFPAPVTTDCVALVTDSAFGGRSNAEVTLAEVTARSALGSATPAELVQRLRGGGADAEAAAAMLRTLGETGFSAAAAAFADLDEGGRRVALDLLDAAPCAVSAPVFVAALLGASEAQADHAEVRLLRCGAAAAPALAAGLESAKPTEVRTLEEQLSVVAPAEAVRTIVPRLVAEGASQRRALRVLLARAAAAPAARAEVLAALANEALPEAAALELLRALGPLLPRFEPAAGRALARLARKDATFRTRFLLAEPTAALASANAPARAWLAWTVAKDPDPHVRARFAEAITEPGPVEAELLGALHDDAVRVRVAALEILGRGSSARAGEALADRLDRDPWPMARGAAAFALGAAPPDPALDRALIAALRDDSPHVRQPVVVALGARRVTDAAAPVRRRLADRDEDVNVRIAAAGTAAALCDASAVEPLTRLARRFADPQDQSADRRVAPAAVTALGRLHPRDLRARLTPLLAEAAPAPAREAAQAALAAPGQCGPAGSGAKK